MGKRARDRLGEGVEGRAASLAPLVRAFRPSPRPCTKASSLVFCEVLPCNDQLFHYLFLSSASFKSSYPGLADDVSYLALICFLPFAAFLSFSSIITCRVVTRVRKFSGGNFRKSIPIFRNNFTGNPLPLQNFQITV